MIKLRPTIFTIFLLAFSYVVCAKENINLTASFSLSYDSNPFCLSDNEKIPLPIKEDIQTKFSLYAEKSFGKIRSLKITPSFNIEYTGYKENSQKSYLSLKPKIVLAKRGFWISSYYRFVPQYSIRPVADKDNDYDYSFPTYTGNELSLRSGYSFYKDFWMEIDLKGELNYYDKNFLEYDETAGRIGYYLRYDGKFYTKVGYLFTSSSARGYDTKSETKDNSNDTDPSYNQDEFSFEIRKEIKNISLGISYDFYKRYFTSKKGFEDDPIHYTRVDTYNSVEPKVRYSFKNKLYFEVNFQLENRSSESKYKNNIGELKDYERITCGIKLGLEDLKLSYQGQK